MAFLALILPAGLLGPKTLAADTFPIPLQLERGLTLVDYQPALNKAKAENKIVLLYFWAEWCGNCQIFSENVLTDQEIIRSLNKDFVFVSLDVDKETEMAKSYRVRAVPTIVFLDSDSKPASVLPGAIPGQVFTMVLTYMSSGAYADMEFSDYFETRHQEALVTQGKSSQAKPLELATLARQAYKVAKNPLAKTMALGAFHLCLKGLTTTGYWSALTLASKKLTRPESHSWQSLANSIFDKEAEPDKSMPN
jgi:thioredoxin-related protein